jgi:predicted metal-dependent HD superfamily phosphohydrolase
MLLAMSKKPQQSAREELVERWREACARARLRDPGEALLGAILAAYSEGHRRYHALAHLLYVLRRLDVLCSLLGLEHLPLEVVFAAFYHDAVYDPKREDNEERSGLWAEADLRRMGATEEFVAEVGRLVRTTAGHAATDEGAALLHDADLGAWGESAAVHEAAAGGIREEYDFVPEEIFRRRRAEILESFLGQAIFLVPGQREREARALRNLKGEIRSLRA